MKHTLASSIALCAATDLPSNGEVPEWVHLLPAIHGEIRTFDGRGPYRVTDPAAIIATSMAADPRDKSGLIIDENHAVDIAAPQGGPSPSRGKILAMEAREDGIWGKIKWNKSGQALLEEQAYRGISPVITHDESGQISSILRASLVNYPNLRGLASLNQESPMNLAKIAKKLGLAETATEAEVLAAIDGMKKEEKTEPPALQAQLAEIGAVLGVANGDAAAILVAAQAQVKAKPKAEEMAAMQAEVAKMAADQTKMANDYTALQSQIKREKSEAFVDAAIAEGRPTAKSRRAYWVALHMENPTETEATLNALPVYGTSRLTASINASTVSEENNLTALNAEQQGRVLHNRAVAYQSQQKAAGVEIALFDAINHVKKEVLL